MTLKNQSGTGYRNARLQLIAGEVNRVAAKARMDAGMERMTMAVPAAPPMEQEAFSEYHLYTLQRRTSVNENETKQLALLSSPNVPVEKRFVVDGQSFYYRGPVSPGAPVKNDVKVYYRFKNDEKSGLGMPMPAGIVRVYQADSKGGVQFAGEDRIEHTPKDETLNLHTGNAFDVVCERRQLDFRRLSNTQFEMEFEITLRNHKDVPITVEVNEPVGGDWDMLERVAQVREDRRLLRALRYSGGQGRHDGAQVQDQGQVLTLRDRVLTIEQTSNDERRTTNSKPIREVTRGESCWQGGGGDGWNARDRAGDLG